MLEGLVEEGPIYLAPRVLDEFSARADRVPRGVVCLLVPYSQPFLVGAAHSALALYAGNAVVMKSSKFTPGVGQEIAALWDRCKLPRGVFNMVQGSGSGVGRRLVCHRSVDLLLFTGGFEGAKAVREMTLDRPGLPVIYQCGGKGMAVVLDDADLEGAAFEVLMGAFLTAGQRHNSTARVLISDRVHDRFVESLVERAEQLKVGYGFDPGVFMGPLISERMRSRYQRYGRALVGAGHEPLLPARVEDVGSQRGYYVRPSIVSVDWRVGGPFLNEEPPGPTLLIYKVSGWEEAAALHNQAVYRSVTSVFARADNPILPELRDRLRTGSLNINRGTLVSSARLPSVGLGRSGSGTPGGLALLEAFTYWRSSIVDRRGFDPAASLPGMGFGEGSSDPLTDEIDLDTLADVSAALEAIES
jgi:acyl-CoA reductase-like NAD-dependent aldehyde dehydrogenase